MNRCDTPALSVDKVSKDLLFSLSAQFFEQTRESFTNDQRPICVGPTLVTQDFRDSVCLGGRLKTGNFSTGQTGIFSGGRDQ